jgi:peptidoglycan/xylan/chitin deacetylase (PgdA/CDA1 family)
MIRLVRIVAALIFAGFGLFTLYEYLENPATAFWGPVITHGSGHRVALTFDDGPNPITTPLLLSVLEQTHTPATFFVVGRAAVAHPDLLARMHADGDEVENHTATHPHLNVLLRGAIDRELTQTQAAIVAATGIPPSYVRPPFGARNFVAIDEARRRGYRVVLWSAMLGDQPAMRPSDNDLVSQLMAQVHDGAIIVLHDGDQGRDGLGGRTYEAALAPAVIIALKAHGYQLVTLDALLQTGSS